MISIGSANCQFALLPLKANCVAEIVLGMRFMISIGLANCQFAMGPLVANSAVAIWLLPPDSIDRSQRRHRRRFLILYTDDDAFGQVIAFGLGREPPRGHIL
jgi:hypothetical protein